MKQETIQGIQKTLEEYLQRVPDQNDIFNALADPSIVVKFLVEKIEELEERIITLEKNNEKHIV